MSENPIDPKVAAAEAAAAAAPKPTSSGGTVNVAELVEAVAASYKRGFLDAQAAPSSSTPTADAAPPTYRSPGAPAGAPPETLTRDATKWSRDYVQRLQSDGSFLKELEAFRASLPGGAGGIPFSRGKGPRK